MSIKLSQAATHRILDLVATKLAKEVAEGAGSLPMPVAAGEVPQEMLDAALDRRVAQIDVGSRIDYRIDTLLEDHEDLEASALAGRISRTIEDKCQPDFDVDDYAKDVVHEKMCGAADRITRQDMEDIAKDAIQEKLDIDKLARELEDKVDPMIVQQDAVSLLVRNIVEAMNEDANKAEANEIMDLARGG